MRSKSGVEFSNSSIAHNGGAGCAPSPYDRLISAIYEQCIWDIKYSNLTKPKGEGFYNFHSAVEYLRRDPYHLLNGRMRRGIEQIIEAREYELANSRMERMGDFENEDG